VAGRHVLIVRRFDRVGRTRIPFLSAMSMLGASDRERHSYLEIVDALRQHGADVARDLSQLWRRIVLGVLVSNLDDHLRNHGFLYDMAKGGWRLSPAYDINPVPIDVRSRVLSMMIDDQDDTASFDLVLEVGDYFGLRADDMKVITGEVTSAISRWREEAALLGISNSEITRMASAFEHDELRKAREYGRSLR
jgi:serine/threonine-protein kinase HipA